MPDNLKDHTVLDIALQSRPYSLTCRDEKDIMITRIMQTKDVAMQPTGEQQNHKVSVRNNKKDVNCLKCSLSS